MSHCCQSVTDKEQSVTDCSWCVTDRFSSVSDRSQSVIDKEQSVTDRSWCVTDRFSSVFDRSQSVTDKEQSVTDRSQCVTDRFPSVIDRSRSVTDKKQSMTDCSWSEVQFPGFWTGQRTKMRRRGTDNRSCRSLIMLEVKTGTGIARPASWLLQPCKSSGTSGTRDKIHNKNLPSVSCGSFA